MPHRARHLVTFTTVFFFLICASYASAQCADDDNDGWTTCNGDCDDTNAAISPADKEKCDGVDNDCAVYDELVITCELGYDLDADLPVLELPEGAVDATTVESCNDPSFDELARTDHDGTLDLDAQDEASLAFWAVGEELMCEADGNGAVIRAEATDGSFTSGTTGLSTFDMFGEFEHIRVCEAFGIPGL